jgi:hypothetical protein
MSKIFAKFLAGVLFFTLAIGFFPAPNANAAGATLYLSPSTGTYSIGDSFNVNVILNSGGGSGVNASDGNLKFDNTLLSVGNVTKDNSVFSLWTADPTFSNAAGTITYSGGAPKAYSGSSGTIISISFKVLKAGTGSVSFVSATALAADGQGTNILSGNSGAQFTFIVKAAPPKSATTTPATTPAASNPAASQTTKTGAGAASGVMPPRPEINSATHLNPDTWYANNNPEFDWKLLPDVSTVSFSLNQSSSSDPGNTSSGIIETKTFANVADGRDYFHLKFQNKSGWGPVATRQVLIDTTPPTSFTVNINNGGDPTNPVPGLSFKTTDVTSGIADYKFNLDGEITDVPVAVYLKNAYALPILKPGAHQLVITVTDQAGNMASSSAQFSIESLKAPVITSIPVAINRGDQLAIQGVSFYPDATVTISLSPDGKNIKTLQVKTDNDGSWTYLQPNTLGKGDYQVWAQVTDGRGAQSAQSAHKELLVQAPSIVAAYGLWIIIFLLIVIVFLILLMIFLSHQAKVKKGRAIRESQELEKRMNEIFAALKEEVNELMELADKKVGYSESEKRVRDKINEALDISQEFISKEIKDVEKEIE